MASFYLKYYLAEWSVLERGVLLRTELEKLGDDSCDRK